jgi:hypothetical protein
MFESPPSPLRAALILGALVIACGCSSNVQDLGHNGAAPMPSREEQAAPAGLEGERALVPPSRDLACPLSRPIEGDDCGLENGAPCTFVGAPEASPDQTAIASEVTTTFCICTAEHRWSCLQGVTMKTLVTPLHSGDACETGLVVERDGVTCHCAYGIARCEP